MAHLMSQPPSRSKQDVQLSSSNTYSYNENQIAPERQSSLFSLHVLVHHTSRKRRRFLVIDTSGPQVCLFSVCPYLGVRQFVAEAGSTFGRFHPHLYSTFPLIFFQPPLCWLMPQYHRSDPHFPAIIRPFTLHQRGERIIRCSNNIRIPKYSYSYSVDIFKPNNIRIRIRVIFSNRIIFVFVFG